MYLFCIIWVFNSPDVITLQKEAREEAEAPQGVAVAGHQEVVERQEVVVVVGAALEVIVVAEALEVGEGSASAVAVAAVVDMGEVVVVFEAHDMYRSRFRREFAPPSFNEYVKGADQRSRWGMN